MSMTTAPDCERAQSAVKQIPEDVLENNRLPVQAAEDHGPEALVRMETRIIDFLRCLMIVMLAIVASAASVGTYKLSVKWEIEAFLNDFDGVATRMAQIFLEQTAAKIWLAYSLSVAVTELSQSNFPNATPDILTYLGEGAALNAKASRIVWSPLLHNESERTSWQAYAQSMKGKADTNICYVCGSKDMAVAHPDAELQIGIDLTPTKCKQVEEFGLGGLIPMRDCRDYVPSIIQEKCGCKPKNETDAKVDDEIANSVFRLQNGKRVPVNGSAYNFPIWQIVPGASGNASMFDQMSDPLRARALVVMLESRRPAMSTTSLPDDDYDQLMEISDYTPSATLFQPVFESHNSSTIVGTLAIDFSWSHFFSETLPLKSDGLVIIFENDHGQAFSFQVHHENLKFVGQGDIHDPGFNSLYRETTVSQFRSLLYLDSSLSYKIRIYPSNTFKARYLTSKPGIYTAVVLLTFVLTSVVFVAYDCLVRRRQRKVMQSAIRNDEIVSSLFPANIRARLFSPDAGTETLLLRPTPRAQLRNLLAQSSNLTTVPVEISKDPIADFFPRCSVVIADIKGFTAWSSEREPHHVFRLLETLYQAFDQLAKKHGVFKIETIGDSYVAATGVPEAQEDHAVRITRFAHECIVQMRELTKSLESFLGPCTADLCIRVGIHSGPVTGGVLRGEKARFQLFGDTMNTAARMEATGKASLIQVSPATAELLQQSGMSHWLQPREEGVFVKGKGYMQTYWVDTTISAEVTKSDNVDEVSMVTNMSETNVWGSPILYTALTSDNSSAEEKLERLVDWNADLLQRLLQRIVARRNTSCQNPNFRAAMRRSQGSRRHVSALTKQPSAISRQNISLNPIEEMKDCLTMPQFCARTEKKHQLPEAVVLEQSVQTQLREYVRCVAAMYQNNPFHNFDHASHVAMSAWKIMNRIIRPEDASHFSSGSKSKFGILKQKVEDLTQEIHRSTFGICSDPLMQFAVVFCALIHDADHPGVTNAQLVMEENEIATKYSNKCVAEQNSVHLCWKLLLEERFAELLTCICATDEECQRFRQLVVNAVIATDIADKELQMSRKKRWDDAFEKKEFVSLIHLCTEEDINRKATVVFEYIIQASDVAHTMQHWYVYTKWNERLFEERLKAYLAGREPIDPSLGWYEGELWFFDNYIIPLANKLEHCGVFGVSSDEYLNYALENRREWELKGQDIVQSMVEKYSYMKKPESVKVTEMSSSRIKP